MTFPGVISRPLLADEFTIYLDNTVPIPLSTLATFLGKIDKAARDVRGMDGLFLELSDFAIGSNELRLRVVGRDRKSRDEEARQERIVAAAEKSAAAGERSATAAMIGAGAAIVSSVAAVVAIAIASGPANPSSYRITNQFNVDNIYIQAPNEEPHIVTRQDIAHGRRLRLSKEQKKTSPQLQAENEALMTAMDRHEVVNLAGRFFRRPNGGYSFETMIGNRFPVRFKQARAYEHTPVALQAVIHDSGEGPVLDVIELIAELSDY